MKRIAVYSSTGGVGKSFIAANLAYALFRSGVNVALCDLSYEQTMLMYFGSNVFNAEDGTSHLNVSRVDSEMSDNLGFCCYRLHDCFVIYSIKGGSNASLEDRVNSALKIYEHKSHVMDVLILDIPTNFAISTIKDDVDIFIEVVGADPVSLSTSMNQFATSSGVSYSSQERNHHVVINKKDLRSQVLLDANHTAEIVFSDTLMASVSYDTAVPEAYASKVLLHDYAPQSQASLDIEDLAASLLYSEKIKRPQKDTA